MSRAELPVSKDADPPEEWTPDQITQLLDALKLLGESSHGTYVACKTMMEGMTTPVSEVVGPEFTIAGIQTDSHDSFLHNVKVTLTMVGSSELLSELMELTGRVRLSRVQSTEPIAESVFKSTIFTGPSSTPTFMSAEY